MSLQLQIIHIPEGELLADTLFKIASSGGIIGRAPDCTVSLPDNSRMISSRHARLLREDDKWLIEDVSINGLFINQSSGPLGRNKRHTLTDGDILTCGEYRIQVNLFSPEVSLTPSSPSLPSENTQQDIDVDDPFAESAEIQNISDSMMPSALDDPFAIKETNDSKYSSMPVAEDVSLSADASFLSQPLPTEESDTGALKSSPQNLINVLEQESSDIQSLQAIDSVASPHLSDAAAEPSFTAQTQENATVHNPPAAPAFSQPSRTLPAFPPQAESELYRLQEENQRLREMLKKKNRMPKKMIYHCMGEALEQTLMDFSPSYLETLFDDYSTRKRGWLRTRDNWQLYSRHFKRVMKEQTLRLTFTARFQTAMRKLQEKET